MVAAGGYGAVAGLALLILVSLFQAHFAIERHLRLLQGLLEATSPPAIERAPAEAELRAAAEEQRHRERPGAPASGHVGWAAG